MHTIQFVKIISTFDSVQTKVWCKPFSSKISQSKGLRIFRTEWLAPNFCLNGIENIYNFYNLNGLYQTLTRTGWIAKKVWIQASYAKQILCLHQFLNGLHQQLIHIKWLAPLVDLKQIVSNEFLIEMSGLPQTLILTKWVAKKFRANGIFYNNF